jgi:quercetin dioxygenase-like cupin family protein
MSKTFSLKSDEIMGALMSEKRQYLCGDLKKPQKLPFYRTSSLEVGMTLYEEKRCDEPHYHKTTEDVIYVLRGTIRIMEIDSESVATYSEGDVVIIPVNVPYISKAETGSVALFVKNPLEYDKVKVYVSGKPSVLEWMNL